MIRSPTRRSRSSSRNTGYHRHYMLPRAPLKYLRHCGRKLKISRRRGDIVIYRRWSQVSVPFGRTTWRWSVRCSGSSRTKRARTRPCGRSTRRNGRECLLPAWTHSLRCNSPTIKARHRWLWPLISRWKTSSLHIASHWNYSIRLSKSCLRWYRNHRIPGIWLLTLP